MTRTFKLHWLSWLTLIQPRLPALELDRKYFNKWYWVLLKRGYLDSEEGLYVFLHPEPTSVSFWFNTWKVVYCNFTFSWKTFKIDLFSYGFILFFQRIPILHIYTGNEGPRPLVLSNDLCFLLCALMICSIKNTSYTRRKSFKYCLMFFFLDKICGEEWGSLFCRVCQQPFVTNPFVALTYWAIGSNKHWKLIVCTGNVWRSVFHVNYPSVPQPEASDKPGSTQSSEDQTLGIQV